MKYTIALYRALPYSMFGTTTISARPATEPSIPLIATAPAETVLSRAGGPSTTSPLPYPSTARAKTATESPPRTIST